MEDEIWKPIPSLPGYEASSNGRIRNNNRIVLQHILAKKYLYFGVYVPELKQFRMRSVSRMVAEAFHGPLPPGLQVNHIDENKTNNRPSNLKYASQSENIRSSYRNNPNRRKPAEGRKFLTAWQYDQIRRLAKSGLSQVKISKIVGCTNSAVSKVLNGKSKLRIVSIVSNDAWLAARIDKLSSREIAREAGVSVVVVQSAIKRFKRRHKQN